MNNKQNLTKAALIVLRGLENEKEPIKPETLAEKLGIKMRTIRYGLKLLKDANLVIQQPDLHDLRSNYYLPNTRQQNLISA